MAGKTETNYTRKAVRGTAVIFIGLFVAAFISYLVRMFLARVLTQTEFGLFYAVFNFVIFFTFFRAFGLNSAVAKFIPEYLVKKKYDDIKTLLVVSVIVQLILSVGFILVIVFLADFLSVYYFKEPYAAHVVSVFSIIFIVMIFDDLLKKAFQGFQNMKLFSIMEAGRNIVVLILILIFFKLGRGVMGPVWAYLLASIVMFAAFFPSFLKLFSFFKYKVKITREFIINLFNYSIPIIIFGFGYEIISTVDILILTYFRDLIEVGIYSTVLPTGMLVLFLGRAVGLMLFPMSSELWARKEYKKLSEGFSRLTKYVLIIIVPIILGLIAFSKLFLTVFFGKVYSPGAVALQILLIGTLFYAFALLNNNLLSGIGNPRIVAKIILSSALVNFIANMILIPPFGMQGAALGTTISYIFGLIYSKYYVRKIVKVEFPWKDMGKILLSGILFLLVVTVLKSVLNINILLEVVLVVGIASAVYLGLIFGLKLLSLAEIKRIIKA